MREDRVDRAMRVLTQTFGTPKDQRRGFTTIETAVFSAATFLASRMSMKMRTAESLVRRWYAANEEPEHG